MVSKLIQRGRETRTVLLMSSAFFNWLTYMVKEKKIKAFVADREERIAANALVRWKRFLHIEETKRMIYRKVYMHFVRRTMKRAFKRFIQIKKRMKYDRGEERVFLKKSEKYSEFNLRKNCFRAWRKWVYEEAIPFREKNEQAALHLRY